VVCGGGASGVGTCVFDWPSIAPHLGFIIGASMRHQWESRRRRRSLDNDHVLLRAQSDGDSLSTTAANAIRKGHWSVVCYRKMDWAQHRFGVVGHAVKPLPVCVARADFAQHSCISEVFCLLAFLPQLELCPGHFNQIRLLNGPNHVATVA
jgi:hypothetical protein